MDSLVATIVIAITIVITIIIVAMITLAMIPVTDRIVIKGMVVNIASNYDDRDEAVALMLECNTRMIELLAHLRAKYHVGATDEECGPSCARWNDAHSVARETCAHLLRGYNYEEIHENRPTSSTNTAYSLDKGRMIMICLRDTRPPHTMIDINTIMFVILHEAAHIANWNEWGHGTQFWRVFKFLLREAAKVGVYKPVDYSRHPLNYCSFQLNHNPLFDSRIEDIYQN